MWLVVAGLPAARQIPGSNPYRAHCGDPAPQKDQTDGKQCQMSLSKEINLSRDFAAGVYLFETPLPSQVFVRGCKAIFQVLNLVRYIVLNSYQNMVSNTTKNPHPQLHTVCVYTVLYHREGRIGELERRLEGEQFTKLRRKYQHD